MNLNELRDEAYSIAKANGWHEEEHSDEHYIMLIITEIAEAVQADRKNLRARKDYFLESMKSGDYEFMFPVYFEKYIKNSLEDELSDIVIRCLDLAGLRGVKFDDDFEPDSPATGDTLTEDAFWTCAAITDVYYPLRTRLESVISFAIERSLMAGIDLGFFIRTKMKYNRLRGYKHGGLNY